MNDPNSHSIQPEDQSGSAFGKLRATYLSLAMIGSVLWPLHHNWSDKPRDNFPLSYYPMFSTKRQATETFYYMLGRDAEGGRYLIPYTFAGRGGLNSVRRQIRRIVEEGRAADLAYSVAKRVSRKDALPWPKIVTVAVVRGRYAVDDYFHGRKDPVSEQIKASCAVERRNL
jgi:hypothetical protein